MAEIKKISTELQLLDKFLDTSGDAGTSGQILSSTATGINWINGSAIPGVPGGSGTTNYLARWTPDGDTLGNSIVFDNGTNVGIGTSSVGTYKLNVDGVIRVGVSGTIQPLLSRDSATGGLIISSVGNSGDLIFQGTGGSEKFRIKDDGNVGIGVTSPDGLLNLKHVTSTSSISEDASDYALTFNFTGTTNDYGRHIAIRDNNGDAVASIGGVDLGGAGTTGLYFATGSVSGISEAMRIDSTGNVGIGTTSPVAKLGLGTNDFIMVNPGTGGSAGILFNETGTPSSTNVQYGARISYKESSDILEFAMRENNVDKPGIAIVRQTGNVGINKINPTRPLHVSGITQIDNGSFQLGGTSSIAGNNPQFRRTSGSNDLAISTGGSDRITVLGTGNVGIATTSPGYKLDVNGTSRFVSQLNFEDNLFGSGHISGTTTEKVKKIKNTALESSTETGAAVVHPYFNNDLGNWVARGGTVTFGGLNTTPSLAQQNVMFEPTQDFLGLAPSNITGSTWSITLTSTNSGQINLDYGCWIGITFGSGAFDPDSMLIETNTNANGSGTWTTVLNSSVADTCYYTYQSIGSPGVKAIKFTMGQTSQGPRVCNIFAYNYAADGMKHFFLGKQGGSVFGNIIPGTDYINGGTNFPKLGASGNRWNEIWVDKISDINNSFGTSGQVLSSNTSGQLDWISGSALPGGPYLPLSAGSGFPLTGGLFGTTASFSDQVDINGFTNNKGLSFRTGFTPTNVGIMAKAIGTANRDGLAIFGYNGIDFVVNNGANVAMRVVGVTGSGQGNVGIGTTSPTRKLTVSGAANGIIQSNDTAGTGSFLRILADVTAENLINWDKDTDLRFCTSDEGFGNFSERMRIASNGHVGIGTTNPEVLLTLSETTNNTSIGFYNTGTNAANRNWVIGSNDQVFGDFAIMTSTAIGGNPISAGVKRLYINPAGNVGIGTNSPSAKLDVDGVIRSRGGTYVADIDTKTDVGLVIAENDFIYTADGSSYLRKLIGKTSDIIQIGESGTSLIDGINLKPGTAGGYVQIFNNSSVAAKFVDGKLGIGTTSPNHKLDIYSNENVPLRIHRPNNSNLDSAGAWGIGFSTRGDAVNSTTDTRAGIFSYYNGNLFLATNNTRIDLDPDSYARLTILSTGSIKFNAYNSTNNTGTPTYILGTDSSGNVVKVLGGDIPGGGGTVTGSGTATQVAFWNTNTSLSGNSNLYWDSTNNHLGIGDATPGSRLKVTSGTSETSLYTVDINHVRNNPNVATHAMRLNVDLSGADNTTADRINSGLFVDIDSSANGDSSNEHRIYGVNSQINFTGFTDIARGGYFLAESNYTGGKTAQLVGVYGQATHDANNAAGGVSNMIGAYGFSSIQDTGDVDNAFGVYGLVAIGDNRLADVGVTKAVEGEITIDKSTALNYGNMIGVSSVIDNNEGAVPNFGNQYLFKGDYQGDKGSNAYGIFCEGDKHYLAGNLGLNNTSPTYRLDVSGSIKASVQGRFASGSAATPSYSFDSDSDSGMFRATTNALGFSTAATERMRILANGNVGIGITNVGQKLEVSGNIKAHDGYIRSEDGASGDFMQMFNDGAVTGDSFITTSANNLVLAPQTGILQVKGENSGSGNNARLEIFNALNAAVKINLNSNGDSYLNGGDVGIGTSSPAAKLDVAGVIFAADGNKAFPSYSFASDPDTGMYRDSANVLTFAAGTDRRMSISSTVISTAVPLGINTTGVTSGVTLQVQGNVLFGSSGVGDLYLGNYATANHFRFHTNNSNTFFDMNCGDIYWRQGTGTRYTFFPSTANMTVNGTITQLSDIRNKENIVEIGDCINKVQAMRGVYYNRTDINTEVTKVGVIAQEVENVLPELIIESPEDGLKSVAYSELTAVLINAIKEQQEIIEDLKTRITKLEN